MFTLLTRTIAAAALAAALASQPGSCAPLPNGGPPTLKACDITLAPPWVSHKGGVAAMQTQTIADCIRTPIAHIQHVNLQREVGPGVWATVAYRACGDIPYKGHPVTCTMPPVVPCIDGRYRTMATVTGTRGDGADFAFNPDEKPEATLRCA